jgi:hypothetical protein
MKKSLKKSESIRRAVEAYKNDPKLIIRKVAAIYQCAPQSALNRLHDQIRDAANCYASQQKLISVEDSLLVEHIIRNFKLSHLIIPYEADSDLTRFG